MDEQRSHRKFYYILSVVVCLGVAAGGLCVLLGNGWLSIMSMTSSL